MKGREDERWLDEVISRTINTTKPEFDSERWKQKYPEEFQVLVSRAKPVLQTNICWRRAIGIAAIAASLILAFSLLLTKILSESEDMKMDTSPCYILPDYQNSRLQETKPCDILPPLPQGC